MKIITRTLRFNYSDFGVTSDYIKQQNGLIAIKKYIKRFHTLTPGFHFLDAENIIIFDDYLIATIKERESVISIG